MENCDCLIGFLCGDEVKMSELERMTNDISEFQLKLKQLGLLNKEALTARQIVDGRVGYLRRFAYCPYCGNKTNWTTILRKFR